MHVSPRIEILHSEYQPKAHRGRRRDTQALTTAQKQRLVGARPVRAAELWTKIKLASLSAETTFTLQTHPLLEATHWHWCRQPSCL